MALSERKERRTTKNLRLFGDLETVRRYIVAGVIISALFFLTSSALNLISWIPQLFLNPIAFIVVNIPAYLINSRFVFRESFKLSIYLKFVIASSTAFVVTTALGIIFELSKVSNFVSTLLITLMVPPISFILHKTFTFAKKH